MSFAPPPGPPPPPVPDGWKAQYDDRYNQWFFVNLYTGKSQWEQPETPAQKQEEQHEPPSGPPPSYEESGPADPYTVANASEKKAFGSNNPYNQASASEDTVESDSRLAARLQAEENAQSRTQSPAVQPGSATDYYNETPQSQSPVPPSGQSPASFRGTRDRSRSFLSKLMGKKTGGGGSSSSSNNAGYGYSRPPPVPPQQPAYGYPQGGYYGGFTPQPQMGYGYPMGGGGYYPGRPQRQGGTGMGNAGAAALGVGGGMLGGAMLANAFDDHGDTYIENNNYDGDGGDFGGGDFGGDDFGGDF